MGAALWVHTVITDDGHQKENSNKKQPMRHCGQQTLESSA